MLGPLMSSLLHLTVPGEFRVSQPFALACTSLHFVAIVGVWRDSGSDAVLVHLNRIELLCFVLICIDQVSAMFTLADAFKTSTYVTASRLRIIICCMSGCRQPPNMWLPESGWPHTVTMDKQYWRLRGGFKVWHLKHVGSPMSHI